MKVTRRWKRDGSKNFMDIERAADSIRRNGKNAADRKSKQQEIVTRLIRGEKIETGHAEFYTSARAF